MSDHEQVVPTQDEDVTSGLSPALPPPRDPLRESLSPSSRGSSDDDDSGTEAQAQAVPDREPKELGPDLNALPSGGTIRGSKQGGMDPTVKDSPPSEDSQDPGESIHSSSPRSPDQPGSDSSQISHSEYTPFGEDGQREFNPEEIINSSGSSSSTGSGSGRGTGNNSSPVEGVPGHPELNMEATLKSESPESAAPSPGKEEFSEKRSETTPNMSPLFGSPTFPEYQSPPPLCHTPSFKGELEKGPELESAEPIQKKKGGNIKLSDLLKDLEQHRERSDAVLGSVCKADLTYTGGADAGDETKRAIRTAAKDLERSRTDFEQTIMVLEAAEASVKKADQTLKQRKEQFQRREGSVQKTDLQVRLLQVQLDKSRAEAGDKFEAMRRGMMEKLQAEEAVEKDPQAKVDLQHRVDSYLEKELNRKRERLDRDESALRKAEEEFQLARKNKTTASACYSAAKKFKMDSDRVLFKTKKDMMLKKDRLEASGGTYRSVIRESRKRPSKYEQTDSLTGPSTSAFGESPASVTEQERSIVRKLFGGGSDMKSPEMDLESRNSAGSESHEAVEIGNLDTSVKGTD